jgi:uncharacterized protein
VPCCSPLSPVVAWGYVVGVRLEHIYRYPVKSCRGHRLDEALVEPWGLAGDRRWMLVDENGSAVTAREYPRLVLAAPSSFSDGITVSAPGMPELKISAPNGELVPVDVFGKSQFLASAAGSEASAWFSDVIRTTVRLVYLDDPTRRPTNPDYSEPTDRVSFADGYPLLLTTEESLAELNGWIAEGPLAAEGPLPMTRFRPNVVISGAPAWSEDDWRTVRIGQARFRVSKRCDRCVLTTVNPDTAAKGKEPIATLARHRRWDGKVWFGINLIPDNPGTVIAVGDQVEVAS